MNFRKSIYKQELASVNDAKVIRKQETTQRKTSEIKPLQAEEINNSFARLKYCQEHYEELIIKYGQKLVDTLIEKTKKEIEIQELMNSLNEPLFISTTKDAKRR